MSKAVIDVVRVARVCAAADVGVPLLVKSRTLLPLSGSQSQSLKAVDCHTLLIAARAEVGQKLLLSAAMTDGWLVILGYGQHFLHRVLCSCLLFCTSSFAQSRGNFFGTLLPDAWKRKGKGFQLWQNSQGPTLHPHFARVCLFSLAKPRDPAR